MAEPKRRSQEDFLLLEALYRLKDSDDFEVYLGLLRKYRDARKAMFTTLLTSKRDVAKHNMDVGVIQGLDYAINLVNYVEKNQQVKNNAERSE